MEQETQSAPSESHDRIGARVRSALSGIPAPLRKVLVIVAGSVLIIVGLALVVLPGPFTLPLVIAGVAVLSTEFAWASAVLEEGQRRSKELIRMLANPWALLAVVILVAAAALAAYSWWRPGWWHSG
ncbi:MAG: hypothetical protein E6Q90_06225 [Actinobacteria bacterium]|nr:MAG: hypothetical protein E6Q90_06225 [Actinomycetota bacterium]